MRNLGQAGSVPGATTVLNLPGLPGGGEYTALCKGVVVQKRGTGEGPAPATRMGYSARDVSP